MDGGRDEVGFRTAYASRAEHHLIGIMSGTSLDGIDAVLARIATRADGSLADVHLLAHASLAYSGPLRARVAALCAPATARIDELVDAHYGLAEWYAHVVSLVLAKAGWDASRVDAIALHGQTVWHSPVGRSFPGPGRALSVTGTLQIGCPAVLRERTGIPVVADFRARDMAAGGEGAPLAPYVDALLFGSPTEGRIVQNLGGIGNATVVPAGAQAAGIIAFDTGPGTMVMDAVVSLGTGGGEHYDAAGARAAQGTVSEEMVRHLMQDPYFARQPPKSTGREAFGAAFAAAFVKEAESRGLSLDDQAATATAFTAETIADACRRFILPRAPMAALVAAGGGACNPTLLRMIQDGLPAGIRVSTAAEHGVPDQAREAVAFAVMGHESLMGRPGNLPAVTGARRAVVLGSMTL